MFRINTVLVNDEAHFTVPAGSDPLEKPVAITVDAGSIEIEIDEQSILVGMVNGAVSIAVAEGDKLSVYGKNHKWFEPR